MRSYFCICLSIVASIVASAAELSEVKSRITGVTVYLNGAQVSREAQIILPKGATTLIFRNLPQNIDPQSIQARGEGNFIILSLVHQINYLSSQRKTDLVRQLEDSINIYEDELAWLFSQVDVLKSEHEMLDENRSIAGKDRGVVLNELRMAVDFYKARLLEIKKETIRINRETVKKKERIQLLKNQLATLNVELQKPTSEVLVNVSSEQNVTGKLNLSYTVFEAGWSPSYDIRAKDIQKPVQMIYNAKVFQNTGESWDNVLLRLSTANPQQRGEKPRILPWYIDFEQPVFIDKEYNMLKMEAPVAVDDMVTSAPPPARSGTAANYTQVNVNQTNLDFSISVPYDIPSDSKQYTINIQDFDLPAIYEYYSAPRLDRDAFLLARITGWEQYNLLPGEINLFFEGTYVGKSFLDIRNTDDTLDLSLGRDKGIIITRIKIQDLTSERIIGANKRETCIWEISVRNNKRQAVDLKIEDQVPVSMNKDIEIEMTDISGGKSDHETGIITWKQKIEQGTEKKLRVSYAIKYPRDQRVFID
jgi:uncharacterized protein (TIGR02231 family)